MPSRQSHHIDCPPLAIIQYSSGHPCTSGPSWLSVEAAERAPVFSRAHGCGGQACLGSAYHNRSVESQVCARHRIYWVPCPACTCTVLHLHHLTPATECSLWPLTNTVCACIHGVSPHESCVHAMHTARAWTHGSSWGWLRLKLTETLVSKLGWFRLVALA
jgi:hypothetical protein